MSDMSEFLLISILFVVSAVFSFFNGYMIGSNAGERTGYCQALADIESGKKPLYELKLQVDGTTKWEKREKD